MGFGETESGARPAQLGHGQRLGNVAGCGDKGQGAGARCAGIVERHLVDEGLVPILLLRHGTGQPVSIAAPQPVRVREQINGKGRVCRRAGDPLGFGDIKGDARATKLDHGQGRGDVTGFRGEGQHTGTFCSGCVF